MNTPKKPGRPPSGEPRKETKNVTIDADLVADLNSTADRLETKFGFRPTLSQTLRHLIRTVADLEP